MPDENPPAAERGLADALADKITRSSESALLGVNIRAWLALILVATVCALAILQRPIPGELVTLTAAAVTFYFAAHQNKPQPPPKP